MTDIAAARRLYHALTGHAPRPSWSADDIHDVLRHRPAPGRVRARRAYEVLAQQSGQITKPRTARSAKGRQSGHGLVAVCALQQAQGTRSTPR